MVSYTAVLPNGVLTPLRPGPRDPAANLAVLRLDMPVEVTVLSACAPPVGSIAIVLAAGADASPAVRLTVVQRFLRTLHGMAPVLDLPAGTIEQGGPVLDPIGRLIGLAALGPGNEAMAIPAAAFTRVAQVAAAAPVMVAPTVSNGRRGWLGVALQPITVPDALVGRAGQNSGRMVVSLTAGGPADKAGLRVGDVVLALNGTSTTGPNALRAFLAGDRIGSTIEVKLLRDGGVSTTQLVVAEQPG
jgi:S1-C subfamily serine protease